jgi:hypothetical protein
VRKVKTHFEQIPVETVRKIADELEEQSDQKETTFPNVVVERPNTKTEPYSVSTFIYCRNRA